MKNIFEMRQNGLELNARQQLFIDNFSFIDSKKELKKIELHYNKESIIQFNDKPKITKNDINYKEQKTNCYNCSFAYIQSEDDGLHTTICRKLSRKSSYHVEKENGREYSYYDRNATNVDDMGICDLFIMSDYV